MKKFKNIIKQIPFIGYLAIQITKLIKPNPKFHGSTSYWEQRYTNGGTSGSGSYNRLATFKAEIINSFVKSKNVQSIIEFGCGDGNQLSHAIYPKYIGLDVSKLIIMHCKDKFKLDKTKEFFLYEPKEFTKSKTIFESELGLSLDVIFHLIENDIFENYMTDLFTSSTKFVIIYSTNYYSKQNNHEKNRKFTDWITANQPDWKLLKKIENKYKFNIKSPNDTSECDFYMYEKNNSNNK